VSSSTVGRLVDNLGALFLRQASTWTLTFILILYLPRYLGDTGFGMVTFATALVPLLLLVTDMGVGTFLVKRIAMQPERWSDMFWNAVAVRLLCTVGVACVMLPVVALFFGGELQGLLFVSAGTLAILSIVKTQEFAIQGLEKMRWLAFAEIANKAVVAALGITLLVSGYGVVTYGAVVLLGATAQLLVNMVPLLRLGLRAPVWHTGAMRFLFVGGLPFFFAGAITNLYTLLDVAMLQVMVAQEVVGWYGAAMQLYTTLNFFPLILTTAMLPMMSRLYAERSPQFLPMASRATGFAFMLALPIGVGLAVSSSSVIGLLGYPDAFSHSVPVLVILSLTLIPVSQLMMLFMVITAMDRQREWVRLIVISLIVGLALNLILIPVTQHSIGNGGVGASTAALTSESVQLFFALRIAPAGLHNRHVALQYARSLIAVAAMAGVVLALQWVVDAPIFVFVPAGALIYGVGLLLTGAISIAELRSVSRDWLSSRGGSRVESPVHVAITE
jgi:O-antigen/teichoic acid export membrane protein